MKPLTVFLLRFLLPPLYPALVFVIASLVADRRGIDEIFTIFAFIAFWSYLLAGLPSLLFAVFMLKIENRPGATSINLLVNATLLGGASGALIGALFRNMAALAVFLLVGLVVGFLVEGTVTLLKRRATRRTSPTPPDQPKQSPPKQISSH